MSSCGISLNLSSLESKITANISAMTSIAGLVGFPFTTTALLATIAIANGNILGALKIVVPADALDTLWDGMREKFAAAFSLADVPATESILNQALSSTFTTTDAAGNVVSRVSDAAGYANFVDGADAATLTDTFFGSIAKISTDFVDDAAAFAKKSGLDQLSGYVDINVTDLAKTAIGLGASFDECDFGTSGIQNYFRDPLTGTVRLLANYAPKLGDTSVANRNSVWGLTAAVNSIFQTGKTSVQLQLNTLLGDVVSSGTNYALDKLGSTTDIDPRDLSNIRQYVSDFSSPSSSLRRVQRTSSGARVLINTTAQIDKLKTKISGVFSKSENSLGITVSF
jgi:hypothetical protein